MKRDATRRFFLALGPIAAFGVAWLTPGAARAIDVAKADKKPIVLDVTETAVAAQRFGAREGLKETDQGYGSFVNKLNLLLRWDKLSLGTRIEGTLFWLRPEDRDFPSPGEKRNAVVDGTSRFRDAIYPAKLWLTYKTPNLEATVGDAYVQFGRGLVLSMRRVDELGVDNTVFGGKVTVNKDPIAATLVAGLANPARLDEASGRSIRLPADVDASKLPRGVSVGDTSPQPLFGSDRIIGAEVYAGRGGPLVLGTRAVRFTRCAPYKYDERGRVIDGIFDAPLGSCDPTDSQRWLSSLPGGIGPLLKASEISVASQSLEIPSLWKHGSLYVEAAVQRRSPVEVDERNLDGNAVYGALTTNVGPVTNTVEVKSYRNFYAVNAGINGTRASTFTGVAYTNLPTTEPITQDSMFGFFNACVTGGRMRNDVRVRRNFLLWGAYGFYRTQSEAPGGACDRAGKSQSDAPDRTTNDVHDFATGIEHRFDNDLSYVYASTGGRSDLNQEGGLYYREAYVQYTVNKNIKGPWTLELYGRHRLRQHEGDNERGGHSQIWRQGEHYTAIKVAPKIAVAQGIEYTTLLGFPTMYYNGSILYRFTSESNVKLFVGQQSGGLKCVSGICKVFPPFEGAKLELTLRL